MWNKLTTVMMCKNDTDTTKVDYKFPYHLAFTYDLRECVLVSTSLYSGKYQLPLVKYELYISQHNSTLPLKHTHFELQMQKECQF